MTSHPQPSPTLDDVVALAWPSARLGEALEVLARYAGYRFTAPLSPLPPARADDDDALEPWLASASQRLGLEVEAVSARYGDIETLLRRSAPALLQLPGTNAGFLLLGRSGRWRATLLAPDLSRQRVAVAPLAVALTREAVAPHEAPLNAVLDAAAVAPERRPQALRALLRERLAATQIGGCWLLRQSPASDFWQQLRHVGVPRKLLLLLIAFAAQQGLQIVGWWLILRGALAGEFDTVWLVAWALALLTAVPFQLLTAWLQGLLSVDLGALLKQRLLFGTLRLHPEQVRSQGIGQFLGRVLESETLETLMLGGGFNALLAIVGLIAAAVVLSLGAAGALHVALLLCWVLLTALICWRFFHRSRQWRRVHRLMINDLIERMVGHRTRLAQQPPEQWHQEEDQAVSSYLELSRDVDSSSVQLRGFINRGWLVVAMLGLAHALTAGTLEPLPIATSIGGIMLASQAFNLLTVGMDNLIGVFNAWGQVGPLFHAARRALDDRVADQSLAVGAGAGAASDAADDEQPLLLARDLVYRYRDYGQPVLRGCNLSIAPGDRVLLEGGSGGGKSTLAALLTGLREPTSGLLLLNGLDRRTLGNSGWRRRAVSAPQFHENHVLTETLSFNLLMGRRWPPRADDLREADELCRELGLGDLLDRMPAGLQQMVGESGWQLSHGERSRLFIARALLQRADLIVLDESFAALDPVNLERALRCVLARAPALLVIAHP